MMFFLKLNNGRYAASEPVWMYLGRKSFCSNKISTHEVTMQQIRFKNCFKNHWYLSLIMFILIHFNVRHNIGREKGTETWKNNFGAFSLVKKRKKKSELQFYQTRSYCLNQFNVNYFAAARLRVVNYFSCHLADERAETARNEEKPTAACQPHFYKFSNILQISFSHAVF